MLKVFQDCMYKVFWISYKKIQDFTISRNLDKKLVDREVKKIDDYIREIYDSSISLIPNFTTDRPVISDYRIINAYEYDYDAEEKKITINIYYRSKLLKNIKEFLLTDWKQLLELSKYRENLEHVYRQEG